MIKLVIVLLSVALQFTFVSGSIDFLAIGDWGGQDEAPYCTSGQTDSAASMNELAGELDAQFFLALGDNFYYSGVDNDGSPRFEETFESVYSGANLQKNWYVLAGNHDYNGNVSAQIAYTADSERWQFPASYYKQSFSSADGVTMDLIMIDTVHLAGISEATHDDPRFFDPLPLLERSHAMPQWDWIEQQMNSSTAQYLLVGGHYPVYSACAHGNTATLEVLLRPLLEQYGAHYMAGHDHCMEHAQERGVHHFLTGMGKECCYEPRNIARLDQDLLKWYIAADNAPESVTAGFTAFSLTTQGMTVNFYDQAGNVLYTAPQIPPRSPALQQTASQTHPSI